MRTTLALGCALLLGGCEKIDYIELAPPEVVLKQPKNEAYFEARPMSRQGVRATRTRVSWSVADPTIAAVTEKGLVTPVADGDTEVIARIGDVEARAPVRVIYVDRIEVEPKQLVLKEGQDAATLTVKAFRKNGKPITDRATTLTSQNKAVAQVVGGGASVLPLDPGTTTIDVQVDGAKASVQVTVEADPVKKK